MKYLSSFLNRYPHWTMLLYWPIFGLLFLLAERGSIATTYYQMHCALDDQIPFCEWFLIPYLFWFVYMFGMHIYLFFKDGEQFNKLMLCIILTYSVGLIIFYLFPTYQNMRPTSFAHDNILTRFIAVFYQFDTCTNVCPSLHVVGSLSVTFAGLNCPSLNTKAWHAFFIISGFMISISTLFVKQHSVLDVAAGLVVAMGAYIIVYGSNVLNPNPRTSPYIRYHSR